MQSPKSKLPYFFLPASLILFYSSSISTLFIGRFKFPMLPLLLSGFSFRITGIEVGVPRVAFLSVHFFYSRHRPSPLRLRVPSAVHQDLLLCEIARLNRRGRGRHPRTLFPCS